MARIKIEDLPHLEDIRSEESKEIFGGATLIRTDETTLSEATRLSSYDDGSSSTETETDGTVRDFGFGLLSP